MDTTLPGAPPSTDERGPATNVDARLVLAQVREQMFGRQDPTTVGRFELRELLGRGAHGSVYLADDTRLRRPVALKLLRRGATDPTARARLLREAQALARLEHPNVLTVYDVGVAEDRVFIAMERAGAGTLSRWCAEHPPGTRRRFVEMLELAIEAADGLAAAHDAGITHRDVKPANILIGSDGRPRIADFGLARAAAIEADDRLRTSLEDGLAVDGATLTHTGAVMGTPAYMAPEQFEGHGDAASDQWGLCVTFWEAAYGERPFATESQSAQVDRVQGGPRPPPSERKEVPRWWREVLARGLRRDPSERWPSVAALGAELRRRHRARPRILAVAGTSALGAAAVAWGLAGSPQSPCDAFDSALSDAWNDARSETVAQRPAQRRRMDDFVRVWRATARRTCLDLTVDGDLGPGDPIEADDPTMRCLRAARAEFVVLADAAADASEGLPDGSVESLTLALPDLQRCIDGPFDVDRLGEVGVEIAAELVRAHSLVLRRELDEAHRVLDGIDDRLEGHRAPRLRARLFALREGAHERARDHVAAFEAAEQALAQAELVGDTELTAHLWLRLATNAVELDKIDEADFYVRRVEAIAADRVLPLSTRYHLARIRGKVHGARGDHEAALESLETSLRLAQEDDGEESAAVADLLTDIAQVHLEAQRSEAALEPLAEALRVYEAVYGEYSIDAIRTRGNLAISYQQNGAMPEALRHARALASALDRASGVLPVEDEVVMHVALATMFANVGDGDEARAQLEQADAAARTLDVDHPAVTLARMGAGSVLLDLGDHAGAIEAYESVREHLPGPDDQLRRQWALPACTNLAVAYARAGQGPRALEVATTCESRLGYAVSEVDEATSRAYLAEAYETAGRPDLAHDHYRIAAEILARHDAHPVERPAIEAGLARTGAGER